MLNQTEDKPTLVLDLDETLVHSSPTLGSTSQYDFVVHVFIDSVGHFVPFFVRCRPYLSLFLARMSRLYEIVVFTASRKKYADKVIDRIDRFGAVSRRFYRDSCTQLHSNKFAKNLRCVRRDGGRIVLVDNSEASFHFNQDNGILISGWTDDRSDSALLDLIPLLEVLSQSSDVRGLLSRRVRQPARVGLIGGSKRLG